MEKDDIPEKVQKILSKSKIVEEVETPHDYTFWLQPHENYREPDRINEIMPGWEMHLIGRPFLIRYIK